MTSVNEIYKLINDYSDLYIDINDVYKAIEYIELNHSFNTNEEKKVGVIAKILEDYKEKPLQIDKVFDSDIKQTKKEINPKIYENTVYLNLHGDYAIERGDTFMKWDFSEELKKKNVKNITSIKINNFKFDQMINQDFNNIFYYNYYKTRQPKKLYSNTHKYVGICIEELNFDSFIWNKRKCHFIGMHLIKDWSILDPLYFEQGWRGTEYPVNNSYISFDGGLEELTFEAVYTDILDNDDLDYNEKFLWKNPLMNNGIYHFKKPVRDLNTITLSFSIEDNLYQIDYQHYNKTINNPNLVDTNDISGTDNNTSNADSRILFSELPESDTPKEPIIDLEINYISDISIYDYIK